MFAVDVKIGNRDGGMAGDFAYESEAGLLHARGHEVGGERGNIVGDALSESGGQIARCGHDRASYERVGISGEDLVVVIVGVVEENLCVADAIFSGDGGVVNLRDAHVEQSVTGADDQRMSFAKRISQSGARAEVVWIERYFAGRREQRVGLQSGGGEGLEIPAHTEVDGEMVGDADGVLSEGGVVIAVGIR